MRRIDLKIGFQCNNRCRFCVQGNKREICPNRSDEEVRAILRKEVKDHQGVVFTGGEPTIRKELAEWVKYAKELGYEAIQIQTNGRMFAYKDFCSKVIRAGADEFSPALHASNAKVHNYLTRVSGSFEQTVQGIKNLKSLGQYILTNTVITKPNYKDLPNLAKLLVDLGVDQFQFAFMHINQTIARNPQLIKEIVPKHSEVEPYVKKGLQTGIKAGVKVMTEAIPYCFMKGYEQYIAEKVIPDTTVFDNDLEIDNYGYYRKTKGKVKGPACSHCKYYKICEGPWKEYPEIFGWDEFKPIK
ncbi:MAG: radical SAM protein [Candidatus Nealsonbacteria bacterium]|nr:MAG: radical SAM protein [Candidatus Nealsonbacteria bacterium]